MGLFSGFFSSLFRQSSVAITNLNDQNLNVAYDLLDGIYAVLSVRKPRKKHGKVLFLLDFDGDSMASQAKGLSEEISAILSIKPKNQESIGDFEVLIRVTSPGGAAFAYGYAASQIQRLKDAGYKVTVSVDKIAASGGYMMAVVSDHIIAAPFSIIGSIGVVAEFPNVNRLLETLGVDYKQYTAGKFKRTVSSMGKITDEAEQKFKEDLTEMFNLFKNHVSLKRRNLDIEKVATGEHWYGVKAKELGLVDEIKTSEDFILEKFQTHEVVKIRYKDPTRNWLSSSTRIVFENIFSIIESRLMFSGKIF